MCTMTSDCSCSPLRMFCSHTKTSWTLAPTQHPGVLFAATEYPVCPPKYRISNHYNSCLTSPNPVVPQSQRTGWCCFLLVSDLPLLPPLPPSTISKRACFWGRMITGDSCTLCLFPLAFLLSACSWGVTTSRHLYDSCLRFPDDPEDIQLQFQLHHSLSYSNILCLYSVSQEQELDALLTHVVHMYFPYLPTSCRRSIINALTIIPTALRPNRKVTQRTP